MDSLFSSRDRAGALLLAAALSGCADSAGPPAPAQVQATGGGGQVAPVHSLLPEPMVATVLDASGQPVHGVSVSWAAEGDGSITADSHHRCAGQARARWVPAAPSARPTTAAVDALEPATTAVAESPENLPFNSASARPGDLRRLAAGGAPDYARAPARHPERAPSRDRPTRSGTPRAESLAFRRRAWTCSSSNPARESGGAPTSHPPIDLLTCETRAVADARQVSENIILLTRTSDGLR
jgi:hypothetical protein